MKNILILSVLIIILSVTGCKQSQPVGEMKFPDGTVQLVIRAEDMPWRPCPPNLPSNCEMVVLEGDPKSPDLFSVRFKVKKGFVMPSHTHPKDERVTVLAGKVSVAFGEDGSSENAKHFGPGDYYVNARDAVHTVWADTTSIIQITGIGPWEANFIEK